MVYWQDPAFVRALALLVTAIAGLIKVIWPAGIFR
jgi:hypothetical protein